MSNKIWTRNYDNLYSAAFGYWGSGGSISNPTYNKPCIKDMKGNYYVINNNSVSHFQGNVMGMTLCTNNYSYITESSSINADEIGVQIGTGVGEVSKDDFCLFLPYNGNNVTVGNISINSTYDENTHTYTRTVKIPIAYSGSADLTVTEFGLFSRCSISSNSVGRCMIYHEFIDSPVTLHQNDTLELTFSQSIVQPNYTPYPSTV